MAETLGGSEADAPREAGSTAAGGAPGIVEGMRHGARHGSEPIWVCTDELREKAAALSRLAARLEHLASWHDQLLAGQEQAAAQLLMSAPLLPYDSVTASAGYLRQALNRLSPLGQRLGTVSWQLRLLGQLLLAGLLEYEGAEASIRALFDPAEAERVRTVASRLPLLMLSPVTAAFTLGQVTAPFEGLEGWSDPETVMLLRRLVSLSDEALLGLVGAPGELDRLRGPDGLELFGLTAVAASLRPTLTALTGGAFGQLRPVQLQRTARTAAAAPQSLGELVRRIPDSEAGGAQLRIERYSDERGRPHWVVYLGGTVQHAPDAGVEPFDMGSNVRLMAAERAASTAAAESAMQQAGIAADDPVLLVGYSQGGLIAATLAGQGGQNIQALVTVGSPIGHLQLDAALPVLSLEHRDDLVPALSGLPADHSGADRTVVATRAYPAGSAPADSAVPAHTLEVYARTARRYEESFAEGLPAGVQGALSRLSGEGTAEWFRAEQQRQQPRIAELLSRPELLRELRSRQQ